MAKKRSKFRASFRKNHDSSARGRADSRSLEGLSEDSAERLTGQERLSGKGHLSRRRTVADAAIVEDAAGEMILPEVDRTVCRQGVVLRTQGLISVVLDDAGAEFACATRQLLKQLATDLRHVVAAGDRVWFRPSEVSGGGAQEGMIERIEPRHGVLSRTSRGRQQLIASNVDQIVIVASAAEPRLKPNLIDRYLITAEKAGLRPIVCVNKIDLIDPTDLVPLVGVYAQLGYRVLPVSAERGRGLEQLRAVLAGKQTAFTGQSGVGKSSLLNAVDPGLRLRVQTVSAESEKGRHTTTTAELYPMRWHADDSDASVDGFLVDTPGIRSFELWDVIPQEVAGYMPELRPYVSACRFPDCTHTHETFCAVKDAVADGWIDTRRYESYTQIQSGE
ncbi:ribosome small subunit-dependent GTPase A [Botrimarina hoheduenensis]|uniref:Small ribosomal subunit biogenesis GTPase RsgA n=1 Tax=Botrimarina hoheduenensis TaxID=2528000 RepID=A0A5C5WCV5_9BACT|nr:ribosome small subunit-dependent GTPase A [Botrimarina hoheduenensis]TWT48510.1 putative ribosome biogenesis GTPase RsgA [Botrimarina hoheduenensis]